MDFGVRSLGFGIWNFGSGVGGLNLSEVGAADAWVGVRCPGLDIKDEWLRVWDLAVGD